MLWLWQKTQLLILEHNRPIQQRSRLIQLRSLIQHNLRILLSLLTLRNQLTQTHPNQLTPQPQSIRILLNQLTLYSLSIPTHLSHLTLPSLQALPKSSMTSPINLQLQMTLHPPPQESSTPDLAKSNRRS